MKDFKGASPPYFEIVPGLRVDYPADVVLDEVDAHAEGVGIFVDDLEMVKLDIVEDGEAEARGFAEMLQAVYDKGRGES